MKLMYSSLSFFTPCSALTSSFQAEKIKQREQQTIAVRAAAITTLGSAWPRGHLHEAISLAQFPNTLALLCGFVGTLTHDWTIRVAAAKALVSVVSETSASALNSDTLALLLKVHHL